MSLDEIGLVSETKNKAEMITMPSKIGIKINLFTNYTSNILR